MTTVLLHDLGDASAGAVWRSVAPADWVIPDLPGHGTAPAPRTGHYDPMAAVAVARWAIGDAPSGRLIGVGGNAHSALVHAAGGGCAGGVVVVDGLWGPWRTAEAEIDALYATLRAIVADPAAAAPPPMTGLDPRTTYGYGVMCSAPFAKRFWRAIDQPVLAIETPASTTPLGEREERLAWFAGPTTLVELAADDPRGVVDAIAAWHAGGLGP